jgi:hypothetical protein
VNKGLALAGPTEPMGLPEHVGYLCGLEWSGGRLPMLCLRGDPIQQIFAVSSVLLLMHWLSNIHAFFILYILDL